MFWFFRSSGPFTLIFLPTILWRNPAPTKNLVRMSRLRGVDVQVFCVFCKSNTSAEEESHVFREVLL